MKKFFTPTAEEFPTFLPYNDTSHTFWFEVNDRGAVTVGQAYNGREIEEYGFYKAIDLPPRIWLEGMAWVTATLAQKP